MAVYAIGDIHGRLEALRHQHALIEADRARHGPGPVVHLGDLVDRGPDSRGVVDWLMAGIARGEDWVVLRGNHDRMFSLFLDDPRACDPGLRADLSWLHPRIGGGATLASYGIANAADLPLARAHAAALAAVPAAHRAFLAGLPAMHRAGGAVFVHAGIRPGVALAAQDETDLLWIRGAFLDDPRDHGALVVHGHTAVDAPEHRGNRLNIDTGAGYGRALTTVAIEPGGAVFQLTPGGRLALSPQ